MRSTRLHLVRHGSTVVSAQDRFAGASDVDLSDAGRRQAARLRERLRGEKLAAVYTSPLGRCFETARLIAEPHGLDLQARDGLREIDHGHWEGLSRSEVKQRFTSEYAAWEADPFGFAPEGGTNGASVLARALPVIRAIVAAHPGEQILAVSHKATIRLLVAALIGVDPRRYRDRFEQRPCALNVLEFRDPSHARLRLFDDVSHDRGTGTG
jgi:broad specificity phosphatase PhoE